MSEITRAERERILRRRIRALDLALAAMIQTVERELPDDPGIVEFLRGVASNIRTKFSARYPFARGDLGGGD